MSNYEAVEASLAELAAAVEDCRTRDKAEYDSAHAALRGCGNKRAISDEVMRERLEHPMEMVKFISERGTSHFKTGYLAPGELTDKGSKWTQLTQQLTTLKQRVAELQAATWQGDAAERYRAQLPAFMADVDTLAGLTTSATEGNTQASEEIERHNVWFTESVMAGVDAATQAIGDQPRLNWPDPGWWSTGRNAEQYSFTFFTRCTQASKDLYGLAREIADYIDQFDPNSNAAAELTTKVEQLGGQVTGNGLELCIVGPEQADTGDAKMS